VEQWTNEEALDWAKAGFQQNDVSTSKGNIFMHSRSDLYGSDIAVPQYCYSNQTNLKCIALYTLNYICSVMVKVGLPVCIP
jgi:hypothetical protein